MQKQLRFRKNKKLVHNWGVSDADYITQKLVDTNAVKAYYCKHVNTN